MSIATFSGVKDGSTRDDLLRFAQGIERRLPTSQGEYVTVVFNGAGTDVDIPITLTVTDPDTIRWQVVSTTAAAIPYRDPSGSRRSWTPSHIWLRASAAATMRLFLFTEP